MKSFKIKIPAHEYGRSFRFDFPISCKKEEGAIGVCAVLNETDGDYFTMRDESEDRTYGNISLTTDGEVLYPSLPIVKFDNSCDLIPMNRIMQPVDYIKLGNKLSIVVEESNDFQGEIAYEIKVYMKTKKL